jgi:hypothetical protein
LDGVLFVHDAHAPNYLLGNAIAPTAPVGCKCEVGVSPLIQPPTVKRNPGIVAFIGQDSVGRGSGAGHRRIDDGCPSPQLCAGQVRVQGSDGDRCWSRGRIANERKLTGVFVPEL